MPTEVRTKTDTEGSFVLSAGALASGASRGSDAIVNTTERGAALIFTRLRSGAVAPTDGSIAAWYLLRSDESGGTVLSTDGWSRTDSFITPLNGPLLGTTVFTDTTGADFYNEMDTAPLGPLGVAFGLGTQNEIGQSLDATNGNHLFKFFLYLPELQN